MAYAAGLPLAAAVVGAAGFVLSSTAVIMKMLDERGELGETAGQRAVSILLLEDLAIVPLLAAGRRYGRRPTARPIRTRRPLAEHRHRRR